MFPGTTVRMPSRFRLFRSRHLRLAIARTYLGRMADAAAQQDKANGGVQTLLRFLPMLWPKGEAELKARVIAAVLLVLAGKAACSSCPSLTRRSSTACRARPSRSGWSRPGRRLRDRPLRRGARRQSSQRLVREGRAACRAQARRPRVPPRPRSQPALPPRAAHRLADQGRRAGNEEHRHDALFPPLQHRPDGDRARRHLRHLLRQVRRGPGRGDAGDGRALHLLHARR